jgi:L-asparagine transporter-like permease
MWFHPYGTWAAMAGMIGVLALMALSADLWDELWTSVLVTAGFMIGYRLKQARQAASPG